MAFTRDSRSARLSGRSRSQWRTSYFSESRYSSDPGWQDSCSRCSKGGPEVPRAAPALEELVEDVGGVRPEVGPEVVGYRGAGQLGEVLLELPGRVPPGEIGVGLGEAHLGQVLHDPGPGECLGQHDDLRGVGPYGGEQPLPEPQGLGVGVVDPEHPDAVADPELDDSVEGLPQSA